ncbi:hypothetical protein G3A40_37400 [Paraburkholderia aspalathi]|uniref:hypothetical protein n=1 Tax=Paraburkholderia aspalathi TaxID=1324617 RepID=UPI00190B16F4|nr:hypothetical protein [Paraburkholderia aspalathi]MBK3865423.1 hypothetical protein [Paraburkholderia aspalathi]
MDLQNGTYSASIIESWLRDQAKLSPNSRAWRKALGGGGSVVVGDQTYLFKSVPPGQYQVFRANAAEVKEIFKILDRAPGFRMSRALILIRGVQFVALLGAVILAAWLAMQTFSGN